LQGLPECPLLHFIFEFSKHTSHIASTLNLLAVPDYPTNKSDL
jgi:hypothetical protein